MRPIVVLGLGNELRQDDGVGLRILEELRAAREWPPSVAFVVAGTALMRCLERVRGAWRCLALDALAPAHQPGRVVMATVEGVRASGRASLHAPLLPDLLALLEPDERPACWVLGIEAAVAGYGEGLTPAVTAALPEGVALARAYIERWVEGDDR